MIGFQTLLRKEILRFWKGQVSGWSRACPGLDPGAPRAAWDVTPASAADPSVGTGGARS